MRNTVRTKDNTLEAIMKERKVGCMLDHSPDLTDAGAAADACTEAALAACAGREHLEVRG
eukprot:43719-Eustigmatos_ZCMA.PRE.1